jgi:hypothetical protein
MRTFASLRLQARRHAVYCCLFTGTALSGQQTAHLCTGCTRGVSGSILVQLRPQPLEANQHGDRVALFQRPVSAVLRWTTFSAGRRFTFGF